MAREWLEVYIECKNCYSKVDICNVYKTGLFYKMQNITFKFRDENYVGRKGPENYVMDLRCLNMAGTNKKYFCNWEIA
jgi:hypothetical protein